MSETDGVTRTTIDPYVTHSELDTAIKAVRTDITATETRLRTEWTETVRFEVGRVDTHLGDQDRKINWTLGLIVTLLIAVIGGAISALILLLR